MAATADAATADIARWLTLIVVVQSVSVVGYTYCEPSDEHSHDHHPPGNVWTNTRNRRDFCTAGEERCYNTGQCCPGFVCVASHQVAVGRELIGACTKMDNLQGRCKEDEDCTMDCSAVHASKHCQNPPTSVHHTAKRGLGSSCAESSECHSFTDDSVDRLCCQDVHRGRQGTRRMCDRVTPISVCLVDNAVLAALNNPHS